MFFLSLNNCKKSNLEKIVAYVVLTQEKKSNKGCTNRQYKQELNLFFFLEDRIQKKERKQRQKTVIFDKETQFK